MSVSTQFLISLQCLTLSNVRFLPAAPEFVVCTYLSPPVEVELIHDFVKQLVFNGHLFFSWEKTLVTISVLDLERPSVVSDVLNVEPLLWVSIEDSPNHVFALRT